MDWQQLDADAVARNQIQLETKNFMQIKNRFADFMYGFLDANWIQL